MKSSVNDKTTKQFYSPDILKNSTSPKPIKLK